MSVTNTRAELGFSFYVYLNTYTKNKKQLNFHALTVSIYTLHIEIALPSLR